MSYIIKPMQTVDEIDGKVGYAYMLTWFDTKDNQIARITITEKNGYQISHDGYYYKVGADRSVDTSLIDEMLDIALSSTPAPKQLTLEKIIELSKEKTITLI